MAKQSKSTVSTYINPQYTYKNSQSSSQQNTNSDSEVSVDDLASISDDNLENRVKDFSKLLDDIDSLNDKKKRLWKEIYENAVSDRQNSFTMFKELYKIVKKQPTEHAVHAKNMSSYLERMAKSNDQLIKLAELISEAERKAEQLDTDDLYSQILAEKHS